MLNHAARQRHLPPSADNPFTATEIDRIPVETARPVELPASATARASKASASAAPPGSSARRSAATRSTPAPFPCRRYSSPSPSWAGRNAGSSVRADCHWVCALEMGRIPRG